MPTYDYRCDACGFAFEKFQSITADPIRKCPSCGKLKVRRLIGTGAGIIFKGGGFYETDYRSDSYAKDAKNDAGDSSEKSSDGKSDKSDAGKAAAADKPAAKSEPAKAEPAKKPAAETGAKK
ncbi:MAG: zinc ribbon domain-containing protein [Planctomycetota bacterium]